MKKYAFLMTLLGIVPSGMINAIKITNGMIDQLEIKSIQDLGPTGMIRGLFVLPVVSNYIKTDKKNIVLSASKSTSISNSFPSLEGRSTAIISANFDRLKLLGKYKGDFFWFDIQLSKHISNQLKENKIGIIFTMPKNEQERDDYFFDTESDLDKLNVRFDPPVQVR